MKIKYTDAPSGDYRIVPDFLPDPSSLVMRDNRAIEGDLVRVTLTLPKSTVEVFKKFARKHNTSYQLVISRLLEEYAQAASSQADST